MNEATRTFIHTNLHVECADDDPKEGLNGYREDYVADIRSGLAEVIAKRELSLDDYVALTDFEFESEAAMYDYLATVYAYVFENSDRRPWLPE